MNKNDFSGFSCVIITGASKGFGSALAKSVLSHLASNSTLILSSRSSEKLSDIKKSLNNLNKDLSISIESIPCDLSKSEQIDDFFKKLKTVLEKEKLQSALLINNAGSLGDVSLTIDKYNDPKVINEFFELNVGNALYFTKKFLDVVSDDQIKKFIVNVSSLCAIKPFPSCGLYCASKAARDMMFKVLATERSDVTVLSWAPGPMLTDMLLELTGCVDKVISSNMNSIIENKTYVDCNDSADKLFALLSSGNFTSGDHIDYYDV